MFAPSHTAQFISASWSCCRFSRVLCCHRGCCGFCGECRSGAVWTIQIHFADKEEGECLLCLAHTELLGVSQIVYGENNKFLYYNEQYICSDIYKYVTGR